MKARLFAAVCGSSLALAGCSSRGPTISTTLTDLIAESTDYKVDPIVDFHENVSINGLLLQPQVGAHWYTTRPGMFDRMQGKKRSSPAFALGISARLEEPSFCLTGETPKVDINIVNGVKSSIEKVQSETLKAVSLTVDISAARAAIHNTNIDGRLSAEAKKSQTDALQTRITDLVAEKAKADEALQKALNEYREALATNPGLIVARWTARRSSGGSVSTGIFGVEGSESETISGYLVLGGLRVSSLYFGDDLRAYASIVEPGDRKLFSKLDITTYLMQTTALAYTNTLDLQTAFAGSVSVSLSSLGSMSKLLTAADRVTIAGYIATATNLDNTGSLANAKWYMGRRPMVEFYETDFVPTDRKGNPMPAGEHEKWVRVKPTSTFSLASGAVPEPVVVAGQKAPATQPIANDGWYTVVAVSAKAPRLMNAFQQATSSTKLPRTAFDGECSYLLIDDRSGRAILPDPH